MRTKEIYAGVGVLALGGISLVSSLDNGKATTPPMGWRSWNLFGADVNQQLIQNQMDGINSRARNVNGVPTSLKDLGYVDVGLDDAWQLCGNYGSSNYTYHDENGAPVVNLDLFPDFNKMTDYAHSLGLTAGWYGNNCICEDHCHTDACYQEDVNALVGYGFDSVKLDGCGKQLDLQKWSDMIDATGKVILIENCHWGRTVPTEDWCPWHYFRTSGDIRASYDAVVSNLMTTIPFSKGLSRPGCWGYPDMLEVGCSHGPGGEDDPGLSYVEARTHFGAWCIVSSPLILSHDMTDDAVTDSIWDIITNTEAIEVNQVWAGDSGGLYLSSKRTLTITSKEHDRSYIVGGWQQWSKKLSETSAAVLVMNNADETQTISIPFSAIPTFSDSNSESSFSLRDIWGHQDLGSFSDSYTVTLESHDSAFLKITKGN